MDTFRYMASVSVLLCALSGVALGCEGDAAPSVRGFNTDNPVAPTPATDLGSPPVDSAAHDAGTAAEDTLPLSTWPPQLATEEDSAEVDSTGGEVSLLDGEIVLLIPPGAFEDGTILNVKRQLVTANAMEWVGYIWGRHGKPIRPNARLTVRARAAWVPPGTALVDARLALLRNGAVEFLPEGLASASPDGDSVTLRGNLGELGDVVIAPGP